MCFDFVFLKRKQSSLFSMFLFRTKRTIMIECRFKNSQISVFWLMIGLKLQNIHVKPNRFRGNDIIGQHSDFSFLQKKKPRWNPVVICITIWRRGTRKGLTGHWLILIIRVLKKNSILYHVNLSHWPKIKQHMQVVKINAV